MEDFYKGYIITRNKRALTPFKDVSPNDLLTLEEAKVFPEYAGILDDNAVLVDIDEEEQGGILLNIIRAKEIKCRVIKTTKGYHFLFWNNGLVTRNRTHCQLAIGLTADIKGCAKASYQVLKKDGVEREVVYDTSEYDQIPKWLTPVKANVKLLNMVEGDGRNSALFSYILPLQQNDFTVDECKECIGIINRYILKEPLSDDELHTVLREGAFAKPSFHSAHGGFQHDKFARFIQRKYNIIKINGTLHCYRDGYYQTGSDIIEAIMVEEQPNIKQSARKEVLSYLELTVPKASGLADAHLVAFKNGVLNVLTGELYDFSPEYIITNMIPHNYVPGAANELLDTTMNKLACGDPAVLDLLYQAVGMCLYRKNELRKSFFLLGEKRNGKSTFLDMVSTLLGEENVSNLDLSEIGDRFKTAEIAGKLANIGDDINDEFLPNTATFKKVVSGDKITAERKGQDPFVLTSYAKFFFSANSLPRLGKGKDSAAILDRLIIIPFDATFSKDDPDYRPYIKYELRKEEVMEALIVKAIAGLREVLENQEFSATDRTRASIEEYERVNNPIVGFFDELTEEDYIRNSTKDVYTRYCVYCASNNLQACSSIEFTKQMKKRFGVTTKEITQDKKRMRIFVKE